MLDEREINLTYWRLLGREADKSGLKTYGELGKGGWTAADLEQALRSSEEYLHHPSLGRITAMFELVYGRLPSPEEIGHLVGFVAQMHPVGEQALLKTVVVAFSRSSHPTPVMVRLSNQDVIRESVAGLDATLVLDRFDWSIAAAVRRGEYEPHLGSFIRQCLEPGMVAVDVGANVGLHMLAMAKLVGVEGKVYAFEPSSENCRSLLLTIRTNALENVDLMPVALSDRQGAATFAQAIGGNGGFVYAVDDPVMHPNSSVVPMMPLDCMIDPVRLDFIKIDVEGAEHLVLKGASTLIRKFRPIVVSEFSAAMLDGVSGISGADYLQYMLAQGYEAHTLGLSGPIDSITNPEQFMAKWTDRFRIEDIAFVPVEMREKVSFRTV